VGKPGGAGDASHSEHFTRIVPQLGKLMTRDADMNVYQQII
jgi:quinol monooxygenase YgiN